MSTYTGKTRFGFEPKMSVVMDAAGVTRTPLALRPSLGPLAMLAYKPARVKALVKLSSAPTTGTVQFELYANDAAIMTRSMSINGVTEIAIDQAIDLSAVAGEAELSTGLNVTAAADAGITAEVTAYLDVEQPVAQTGC